MNIVELYYSFLHELESMMCMDIVDLYYLLLHVWYLLIGTLSFCCVNHKNINPFHSPIVKCFVIIAKKRWELKRSTHPMLQSFPPNNNIKILNGHRKLYTCLPLSPSWVSKVWFKSLSFWIKSWIQKSGVIIQLLNHFLEKEKRKKKTRLFWSIMPQEVQTWILNSPTPV